MNKTHRGENIFLVTRSCLAFVYNAVVLCAHCSSGICTSTTSSLWNPSHSLTYQSWKDCKLQFFLAFSPKLPKM